MNDDEKYVTTTRYSAEYTANISCGNNSQIQIKDIDVQEEETTCRKTTCYLNSIDKQSIQDICNGKNSCLVDFNFTSTCLREFRYMNLSYTCRHDNGTGKSTFEENFGGWRNKSSKNYKWQRNNLIKDHTRVTDGQKGYSMNAISNNNTAGEQIHITCQDISKPVRIKCQTQFLVGDIKFAIEPKDKTDCQEEAIDPDLNYVCRNNFNKSEQCYYSVFERRNKSEDCYEFKKNVSVKYLCVDIPDGSLESPVQNDIIGIAAGVSGGVILTIIAVVVICLIKRSKPGKQEASSSNDNKAFDELQNDEKSQQQINLSQSSSQDIITPPDTNLHKPEQLDRDGQESADLYNMSNEDGTYDVSGKERQRGNPNDNNIYSHTADNIYDSGSHHKLQDRNDETYDHFFGQQTEDEYDTTART
ncbi:Hypothetical predicted protein [Mytilus galloprovincialis]|uniref:SUEL-type lectin domain-containing protein n=1 Tax=Mytilus galloprovincialis TaxID=29158 RepID=A0A8B6F4V5_MYTGA|nr:Hypothetical predicted protein [Mytilus galloprovincialis]